MFDADQSSGVLRSEAYLTTRHIPEKPVGRDTELDQLAAALQPLTENRPPLNLLVSGPAGVGKTTCLKHTFDQLEAETGVKSVYINCWQYNTRPTLITELLINLGYPAVRRGKSVDELVSKLQVWLDRNRNIAVGLDEVDQLDDRTEVIYDLQHVNEQADNDLGVVLVSNQPPTNIRLDPRSQSRLSCQTLEFKPYTGEELVDILEHRVEQAFKPGSVGDDVLQRIADHVAEHSGDCRKALELLLQSGRTADQANVDAVTTDHVDQVIDDVL